MVWELVAIWLIVGATLVWFVRDERRLHNEKLERAARFYAQAPQYRFVSVDEPDAVHGPRYQAALKTLDRIRETTPPASGR